MGYCQQSIHPQATLPSSFWERKEKVKWVLSFYTKLSILIDVPVFKLKKWELKKNYIKDGTSKLVYNSNVLWSYFLEKTFLKHSQELEAAKCPISHIQ